MGADHGFAHRRSHDDAPVSAGSGRPSAKVCSRALAGFRQLYKSRDGRLCLFETKDGHLIAVDASRLA